MSMDAREVYRAHAPEVTRFATLLVGPDEATDVVHDAVARLLANGVLSNADNPRALLYRAVHDSAVSLHRSTFRRRRREDRYAREIVVADPETDPDVAQAVARLSTQQRACVFLTYWQDLTPAQVAELLSVAEGTVKAHLAKARKTLREVLDDR